MRRNQADRLLEIVREAELFHTANSAGYADLNINGHRETWPVRGKPFRSWLAKRYYEETGGAFNSEARNMALGIIDARARFDSEERDVAVRVATHQDKIYLDLADSRWRAVEIGPGGWKVVNSPPVRFCRKAGMLSLPEPTTGGTVHEMRKLLNVRSDADFTMMIAWALATLRGYGPYPVMAIGGEQGSAKSTASRILRCLIDPHCVPLRALPRDERDLFIAASNNHVMAFDNVSGLAQWLSDSLCRLSTGGGFGTRELHTDQNEVLFDAVRPIILNGIEDVVMRPDLADRALMLTLPAISNEQRLTEKEVEQKFAALHPAILGALLDGAAHGLRMLPNVELNRKPRMADFALWMTACEGALTLPCSFETAYSDNRAKATETVIGANSVADAVRSLMVEMKEWKGTATELLEVLGRVAGDTATRSKHWPGAAHVLSGRLRRAAPCLREVGINVDLDVREGHASSKVICINNIEVERTSKGAAKPETPPHGE